MAYWKYFCGICMHVGIGDVHILSNYHNIVENSFIECVVDLRINIIDKSMPLIRILPIDLTTREFCWASYVAALCSVLDMALDKRSYVLSRRQDYKQYRR